MDPITKLLITFIEDQWLPWYRARPWTTGSITGLVFIVVSVAGFLISEADHERKEKERMKGFVYAEQIRSLEQTENNMKKLIEFIEIQKEQLRSNEDAVQQLKQERELFSKLVDADRDVINSVFLAQEDRNRSSQMQERWYGILIGVIGSIIASIIISLCTYAYRHSTGKVQTSS